MTDAITHTLTVINEHDIHTLQVSDGENLRRILLDNDISPYAPLTRVANCGGRGLCATCGIWIDNGEPSPEHWHDKVGSRFGYPRLSCQISIRDDMTVRILHDKWIWGKRDPSRT